MSLNNFLSGRKVLETVNSPINGEIIVVRDLTWGTYIKSGGLTQSGGILEKIWDSSVKKITNYQSTINNVLILGLGGGSLAKVIRKYYPGARIIGVDVDPVMIELGRKYLKLDEHDVEVVISDAYDYLDQKSKIKMQNDKLKIKNIDLICVDLYVGDEFPEKFESDSFIEWSRTVLDHRGVAVFNRTYYDDRRKKAIKFGEKLEKHFKSVDWVYPEANLMFLCRK